jgi:hypothetical protein
MVQLKAGISSEAHAVDELYLSLAPHPSSNAAARTALASFFYHQPNACRDDFVGTFLIAVGEALANAIEHSDSHDLIEANFMPSLQCMIMATGLSWVTQNCRHRIASVGADYH